MGPGELVFMIPLTAIVLGIFSGIVHRVLESQERRLKMRLDVQQGHNDEVMQEVQALRAELTSLRDTSTRFDMSLEESVRRLEGRVNRLDTKDSAWASPAAEETVQRLGTR